MFARAPQGQFNRLGKDTCRRGSMKIHWLQHVAFEGLGSIAGWAAQKGCSVTGSRMFAGDALPPVANFDMLIIMGGPMSVNDEVAHPWLVGEKRYVAQAMAAGKMVLGICLGAQMIASSAGARVYPNDHLEIGWFPVEKTRAAKKWRSAAHWQIRQRPSTGMAKPSIFPMAPSIWRVAKDVTIRPLPWAIASSGSNII